MMNLIIISHPKLYKDESMVVKQQVKLKLTIGYYEKKVLCGQVPGKACDILLERPEQINHKTI